MELTPEAAGPVIKDVLGPLLASQGVRGSALRQNIGVTADASLNDFITAARSHPVFELGSPDKPSSQSKEHFQSANCPISSVDTKKTELIGNCKNAGRAWTEQPEAVNVHDFPQDALGKAVPYRIYIEHRLFPHEVPMPGQ